MDDFGNEIAPRAVAAPPRPVDPERERFDAWARKWSPWLLEAPKTDEDGLLLFTALNAWLASARLRRSQ